MKLQSSIREGSFEALVQGRVQATAVAVAGPHYCVRILMSHIPTLYCRYNNLVRKNATFGPSLLVAFLSEILNELNVVVL